jgi:glycosyltransferase involved in cell wall biosynthesis
VNSTQLDAQAGAAEPQVPTKQRVLLVHNRYQQIGGEDTVFDAEAALLRRFGHEVEVYERHNDELTDYPAWRLARDTFWSSETVAAIESLAERFRPQVLHVHNTLPLISPSVYWVAAHAQVAVVQTLHNWRLMCPEGFFQRSGRICEDCLGHVPWRAVAHGCYRNSRTTSAVMTAMLTVHRAVGTYRDRIDRYIALTEFARRKFIEGGLPAGNVSVKPNFISDPAFTRQESRFGGLFVGRLTVQKGIAVLIGALREQSGFDSVRVIGAGDLDDNVRAAFGGNYLGAVDQSEVLAAMRRAAFLIVPSLGYEGFPRTIVEAYACGLPVVASRCGPLAEIVVQDATGLLFEPGSTTDLARVVEWALRNPVRMREMGARARMEYENRYSPEQNYVELAAIYRQAIAASTEARRTLAKADVSVGSQA